MAEENFAKLKKFDPSDEQSCAAEWEDYKRSFLIHLDAQGLENASGRRKVGQLLQHMGLQHVKTYDSFVWAPEVAAIAADAEHGIEGRAPVAAENKHDLDTVLRKFDEQFGVHRFRNVKRQEFLSVSRNSSQSIMGFISDLRSKARYCEYGDKEEGIIIDMIINKIRDEKCTERLMELRDEELTLNNVMRICRQVELTQAHVKKLQSENTGEKQVNHTQYRRGQSRGRPQQRRQFECQKCCRNHGYDQYCRADNEFCGACGQKGHYRRSPLCPINSKEGTGQGRGPNSRGYYRGTSRSRGRGNHSQGRGNRSRGRGNQRVQRGRYGQNVYYTDNYDYEQCVDHDYNQYSDPYNCVQNVGYMESANCESHVKNAQNMNEMGEMFEDLHCDAFVAGIENSVDDDYFHVTFQVNNHSLSVELDTGAKCNILSLASLKKLNEKYEIKPSNAIISGVHGKRVKAIGCVRLPCEYQGVTRFIDFQVLDSAKNVNLLGRDDCVQFGLIKRVNQAVIEGNCKQILHRYSELFGDDIGCLPGEYEIKIDQTVTPVVHPPRPVPSALKDSVREELQEMEKKGIIKKVTEPTPWVNSMVVVRKRDKNKVRICIDPSDLNKAILREHYPMNQIDAIATRLHGSKYFSTLDANKGYFHVKLTEKSSLLTTFNTPFGRYRYLRMPMGAKCSADKFQAAMVSAFEGIDGTEVVVDDILVHGSTLKEHNERLERVLQRCKEIDLRLNKEKCQIGLHEVNYVGHKLTGDGLKPTVERVKAMTTMPKPQNIKELEAVLGMIAYVAKFVPNLSNLTAPLRELKKNDIWQWGHDEQKAFDTIKAELSSDRVLKYFDVKKPILISVDASGKGLGAAAIQDGAVVAYASKALTETEKKYAQIEKEMLAVVFGCTKFHKLIYGMPQVTVESDHKPLETLLRKPMSKSPMRIQRMRLKLEPYSFTLIHTSGKHIGLADCLSRLPQASTEDPIMDEELMICKVDSLAYNWHNEIEGATRNDADLTVLKRVIFHGWPESKGDVPLQVQPYWNARDQLTTYNGIIYNGERIVIPQAKRAELLKSLHRAHTGIVKTKQRARDMIYWPGLNAQIEEMVS